MTCELMRNIGLRRAICVIANDLFSGQARRSGLHPNGPAGHLRPAQNLFLYPAGDFGGVTVHGAGFLAGIPTSRHAADPEAGGYRAESFQRQGLLGSSGSSGGHDEVALLVNSFNEMLTEIQKRDSALQQSEQQFRTLADSIPQLAWMGDAEGNLFWYNHRWYDFTGTTPEQMMGWGWQSVHDPEALPGVIEKWKSSIASGKSFEMIFPLRGADGAYRQFLTLAMPVRDECGRVVRWFGSNTDITEQRRSEEALRQTEKLATGRLSASIAHEINNPLEAVTNLVYLARKQPTNAPKYLTLADQELDRIAQITKNTLGFYRDSASFSPVNISLVLSEVVALYTRKIAFKKINLRPDYGDGIEILAFPGEIRQIFANLLANAIEALSMEGVLRIRARRMPMRDGSGRHGVRISFLDNGSGVALANRKKIFEPFFTTKKDVGTGLGLWLTQGLVEKHHGALQVRNSVRPGNTWTMFSVFLPDQPAKI